MNTQKRRRLPLVIISAVAAVSILYAYRGEDISAAGARAETQDLTSIERRISLLEQRFYGVETSINRLEQQTRLSQGTQSPAANESSLEINLLRGEVETLQRRLAEMECGITKLDERTLSPAAREARKRAGAMATDPCRLNPDSPLKLSTRP